MLADRGFGIRVLEAIDPELIPFRAYALLFSVARSYSEDEGAIPDRAMMKQLVRQRYHAGAITEKLYKKALSVHRKAIRVEPVSRDDAQAVLTEAILDTEVLAALDDSYKLYKDRQYHTVFERMESAQERTRLLQLGSVGFNMRQGLTEYGRQLETGEAKVDRLPIGVAPLDLSIKGGLGRGELGCILGAEKDGKSMALSHIGASNVLLGKTVVYISAELGELEVKNRFTANVTGIPINCLEDGGKKVSDKAVRILSKVFGLTGGDFIVKTFPPGTVTVKDIEAYLRDIGRIWGVKPDVLVIDYADELATGQKVKVVDSTTTYHGMGKIYTDLRAIGAPPSGSSGTRGGFDCAVWTASQVQRGAIGKEVLEFRDVADSILKAAKVDLMVGLCRDEEEREADIVRLYVAACRYAPFPQEVGPFSRDYAHGRLVQFDSTVQRFTQETGEKWQKLRRKLLGQRKSLSRPRQQSQRPRLKPRRLLTSNPSSPNLNSKSQSRNHKVAAITAPPPLLSSVGGRPISW